jgi:hypothetical protein
LLESIDSLERERERERERGVQKLISFKDLGMLHEAPFSTFKEGAKTKP